jgi:hypothetical protein
MVVSLETGILDREACSSIRPPPDTASAQVSLARSVASLVVAALVFLAAVVVELAALALVSAIASAAPNPVTAYVTNTNSGPRVQQHPERTAEGPPTNGPTRRRPETAQGDQLSVEREMQCPPTRRLACPLSKMRRWASKPQSLPAEMAAETALS